MMLQHVGLPDMASLVHNAWLKTIEDGIHTYDIFKERTSKQKVGTKEFAKAVIDRLGQKPEKLKEAHYSAISKNLHKHSDVKKPHAKKELVGVDVFIDFSGDVEHLHKKITHVDLQPLELKMIGNRGVKVWPNKMPETTCADQWRCRLMSSKKGGVISHDNIAKALHKLAEGGLDFIHTENLYTFDGKPGYTVAQDEQ